MKWYERRLLRLDPRSVRRTNIINKAVGRMEFPPHGHNLGDIILSAAGVAMIDLRSRLGKAAVATMS